MIIKSLLILICVCIIGYYYNDYFFRVPKPDIKIRCSNDSNLTCTDKQTCCKSNNGWRCCYGINAVCCGDGKSCCAEGDVCDLKENVCRVKPIGHPKEQTDLHLSEEL